MSDHESDGDTERPSRVREYRWGVRTALRDNATAYGFSVSITAAYGLVGSSHDSSNPWTTISFAVGAGLAFVLVGAGFLGRFQQGPLSEGDQVQTLHGAVDFLSVLVTVAVAYGLSRIPGPYAWPLTGLGTVATYLLISGLDIVLARVLARHTSFARPE